MSIPLPAKVASGVLVGGTAAAGGSFLYKGTSKPQTYPIKDLLASKNPEKRLISTSDNGSSAEGKVAGKAYRDTYKDRDSNPFSLTSTQLKDSSVDPNAPIELINGCKSLFMEQVVDNKDEKYKTVLSYCTRNTLVRDLINGSGKTLLEKGSDFANNGDGKAVWGSYKDANKSSNQDSGNLGTGDTFKAQDTVPEAFVTKCDEKSKVQEHRTDQQAYIDVFKYCTK